MRSLPRDRLNFIAGLWLNRSERNHRMILEIAPLFKRAKGCRSFSLQRGIENPSRYRLLIEWDTVENHTKDFYGSADWQEWRKLVAHCFASPPAAEHMKEVVKGF
jgi:heme-degrading monooxygenase HmoA